VAREILRRAGRAVPLEVGGTCADHAAVGGELSRRERESSRCAMRIARSKPSSMMFTRDPTGSTRAALRIAGGEGGISGAMCRLPKDAGMATFQRALRLDAARAHGGVGFRDFGQDAGAGV